MHIPESMAEQMELAYGNVTDTLAYFGARMSDVVEQRAYATNLDEASAALEGAQGRLRGQGSAVPVEGGPGPLWRVVLRLAPGASRTGLGRCCP